MSPKDTSIKQDLVSSIFNRQAQKSVSSLFAGGKPMQDLASQKIASRPIIKKKLPFGLDIGTNFIKIVQLGYDQEGMLKIIDWVLEELPKEVRDNPHKNSQILEILKKIVNTRGLKGDCFALAPSNCVGVNLIRLPQMPAGEIDNALRWEIKQTVSGELNGISLDYIILDSRKIKFLGNQIGVLAISAPKKELFEYLALLESAGLNPLALDIEPLADLALLLYANQVPPNEVVIFLDFGASKTSINIICNQEFISTRFLNITGNSLTKAVSEYCKVSWEEAETLKKSRGIDPQGEREQPVRNALLSLLENMAQDIEYTFKYFSYQVSQSQVTHFDRIILSGGSSCLRGLVSFLSKRLNINVQLVDSWGLFGDLGQTLKETSNNLGPQLSVALGLALRGIG